MKSRPPSFVQLRRRRRTRGDWRCTQHFCEGLRLSCSASADGEQHAYRPSGSVVELIGGALAVEWRSVCRASLRGRLPAAEVVASISPSFRAGQAVSSKSGTDAGGGPPPGGNARYVNCAAIRRIFARHSEGCRCPPTCDRESGSRWSGLRQREAAFGVVRWDSW